MFAGLILAAALMADAPPQAAGANGPPAPVVNRAEPVKTAESDCSPTSPDPGSREVVVCVQKSEGFRIDPDVLAARKAKKEAMRGRLKTPQERMKDTSCTVVGPAGCVFDQPGINLLAAAATLAQMGDRLAKGQEIGSMFVTDPQLDEYGYYKQAKKDREAEAASRAAKAHAAEIQAQIAAAKAKAQSTP